MGWKGSQKDEEDIVSEAGEDTVQRITDALLQRGNELLKQERHMEAAGTAFAILVAVEPQLCYVYDEGITYQSIVEGAFDFLGKIGQQAYSLETAMALVCIAIHFFEGREEDDRYYDDEWKAAIVALGLDKKYA